MKSAIESGLYEPSTEKPSGDRNSDRFYLKTGESADVVVLSQPHEFRKILEHEVWIDNRPHYATCCQPEGPCDLCELAKTEPKLKRKELWVGTVLCLKGYKKQDGTEVNNVRKLLPLNFKGRELFAKTLEIAMEEGHECRGGFFKASRSGDKKSIKTGDIWIFRKMADLKKMEAEDIQTGAFDVTKMEEFKPSRERCSKLAQQVGGSVQQPDNSDVPF